MAKRKRLSRKGSKKLFTATAGSHGKNYRTGALRGGIRL